MSNFTPSNLFLSDLPDDAINDFKEVYNNNPRAIEGLCDFPGRIGELAKICQAVGCK